LTCGATTCTGGECPSVCAFNATVCKADTDCTAANYECATVSKSSWCSGGAAVACDKDGTCSTVATTAPDCGTTEIKQCMPKLIDCSAGQTCPAGWSCYDSSDHAMSAPSWWNVTDVIKACMPDGITMVVDGHALGSSSLYYAGGGYGISGGAKGGGTSNGSIATGVPSTDSQGSGGSAGTRPPETAPSSPSTVNNNGSTPAAASGSDTSTSTGTSTATDTVGSKSEAGGGCSFGGSHTGAWGLLLTGLAFVLSIRRRRR
jgi:MYXO-CTERM domain-containing protein